MDVPEEGVCAAKFQNDHVAESKKPRLQQRICEGDLRQTTVLIGAGIPRGGRQNAAGSKRYCNVLIARGLETQAIYYQRIPVPIGMWKPLSGEGNWFQRCQARR